MKEVFSRKSREKVEATKKGKTPKAKQKKRKCVPSLQRKKEQEKKTRDKKALTTLSDDAGTSGSVVVSVFQSRMNGNSAPQQPQKLDIATHHGASVRKKKSTRKMGKKGGEGTHSKSQKSDFEKEKKTQNGKKEKHLGKTRTPQLPSFLSLSLQKRFPKLQGRK